MKNRGIAYGLAFGVMAYIMREATNDWETNILLAALVALVVAFVAETLVKARARRDRKLRLINRRDCIVLAGSWPKGEEEGPDLGPVFNEPVQLYEYYDVKHLEKAKEAWEEALAENQSRAEGLADELKLPIIVVYPQSGVNRMETREQYAERLKWRIKEVNMVYHAALEEQNEGRNYIVDYLVRR